MPTANGVHLPAGVTNYRSPASIDNGQQKFHAGNPAAV